MLRWKIGSVFKYGAHAIEKRIDAVKRGFETRFDLFDPVCIVPYHGYGNNRQWYWKGRVVEELGIPEPTADASWWQNVRAMSRRFTGDEIPFVRLHAPVGDQSWECKTDDEGYFEFSINPGEFDDTRLWHDIDLKLLDQVVKGQGEVESVGQVVVPAAESILGVISDIDQHDPQLYRQAVKEFPGRIKGIYIREVGWKDRSQEVGEIAEEVAELDSEAEMRLVRGTVPAAEHAAQRGWTDSAAIDEIRREVEIEEQ